MYMYKFSNNDRLFLKAIRQKEDSDNIDSSINSTTSCNYAAMDLQSIHMKRKLSTEILGSTIESTKTSRKGDHGARRIVTRIIRKTTTLTHGEEDRVPDFLTKSLQQDSIEEKQFNQHLLKPRSTRISDIVVGQESHVTAREALLRWARKSTARYPGVNVSDFTSSWRDGLAFSALMHRNRPDLLDWRNVRTCHARERLEQVFYLAEREYGVTKLLDPEDVDTPEPDEKSLITYISSLYDVFPEPPIIHPLYDTEAQRRLGEYRELASNLKLWICEKISLAQDRHFPPTLIELKKIAADGEKFKNDELPPRYHDKQQLAHTFRDLQKYFEAVGEIDVEQDLFIDVLESNWSRLMLLHQERNQAIIDEIKRLERLQRIAEKVHREMKISDKRLEELQQHVEEEVRRSERLHPLEAKHAIDVLEQDMHNTELQIQSIFADVHSLTEGRYTQSLELHKRVQKLHQRWVCLRSQLHKQLVQPLSAVSFPMEERVITKHRTTIHETRLVDTNPQFRALHDCINWCKIKLNQLSEAEYGSDLPAVLAELETHQREHTIVEQYHIKIEKCRMAKSGFQSDELILYSQHLTQLQMIYTELINASNKRMSDLEVLHDFIQSATSELVWLNGKEEIELSRDWSDKSLNVSGIEKYYESLMSDLEKREIQFSAVQDRGESLILQHHPASKTIEAYMSAMQTQWAWLLQLTLCLEVHLKHSLQSQQFFKDVQEAEQWISKNDEILNTVYSLSEFSLDEGECLIKGMQELREELNNYGNRIYQLVEQAKDVIPLRLRRQPVERPVQVMCICNYKQVNMTIEKNQPCILYDNSGRIKWRIKNSEGYESPVPGVCFSFQPPDKEALDAVEKLKRQYERNIALWQRKQLRLRQNMIFATIKVVKDWNLQQFLDMGQDQRAAIRKALNEDAEKLLSEGDPADPQLRRLRREMDDVNKLFDNFEKRARAMEESRQAGSIFSDKIDSLQQALTDAERIINLRVEALLPFDSDCLEHLFLEHKDYEKDLQFLTPDIDKMQQIFRGITLKTPQMKNKLDNVMVKWNHICNLSSLYAESLKCMKILLNSLDKNKNSISDFEIKLASFNELPSDFKSLQRVLEDLTVLKTAVTQQQSMVVNLNDAAQNTKSLVENCRANHRGSHTDMDRLDSEVNKLNARWANIYRQLVDRLRSAETAYSLAQQCQSCYQGEVSFVDESYGRVENLPPAHIKIEELEKNENLLKTNTDYAPVKETINLSSGRLIREGQQAMEEKYKLCDETLTKYLQWIIEVEDKLSHQDVVNEDIEELINQINSLTQIKEAIEAHVSPISACLDHVRQVVLTGSTILSSDEVSTLEKNGRSLKKRFERVIDLTDRLLKKLVSARDELTKFKNEMSSFSVWLDKTRYLLLEKEYSLCDLSKLPGCVDTAREFINDVIAHQADLRFITMAAQKFVAESKEYLKVLNNLRTGLPQRLSHKEPHASQDSPVRTEVTNITTQYKDLLSRANILADRLSRVAGRQRDYCDTLEKANAWFTEIEPKVHKIISESVAAEPKQVEDQLNKAKIVYNEILASERLLDHIKNSIQALQLSFDGQLPANETTKLNEPVPGLESRYIQIRDALANKCQELETALVQCQGVQDALDNLITWLNSVESQFKAISRPASLQRENLEKQQYEQRLLQADLDSHRSSVGAISNITQELLINSSNVRVAKRTESKLIDVQSRFEKLLEKSSRRSEFLDEIFRALYDFVTESAKFDTWHSQMIELLESTDLTKLDISEHESKILHLSHTRDQQRSNYEDLIRKGKTLTTKKDVIDVAVIRDRIKAIEIQWKELNLLFDEKHRLSKSRLERLHVYEKLRDQVIDWLNQADCKIQRLQPVTINLDTIKNQTEELTPIQKEYREYGSTIDKLNDFGMAYDNLLKERSNSPTRRRSSNSPTRRRSSNSPTKRSLRQMSNDGRSPSPAKCYAIQSPVSPGGSSGFSSRRSSQDGLHLEDLSPTQQQLSEINNRYSLLGVRISDRQAELDNIREELQKHSDNIKTLAQFLNKIQRQLPKDGIPTTKEELTKASKQIKLIIEEMYEKLSLLENTKTQAYDLIRCKNGVVGIDILSNELEHITKRWTIFSDRCKDRIKFLDDIKDLYDTQEALHSWLRAKERMIGALGPISSDPRIVASQVQQVQVLREEFRTQQPQLDHLVQVSESVLVQVSAESSDFQNLKQKLNSILKKWADQLSRLQERAQSLGDAVDTSREFDASLSRLRNALQGISDNLDDLLLDRDLEEQLRKIENLGRQLEGQRPLLADAEAAGAELCEVLSDATSRNDIQGKVESIEKMYSNLQKKLDHKKAEVEGNIRDGRQFEASCSKTLGWLNDELGNMSEKLLVSASREILQQQLDHHEPIYRNVMSKEHEVIMLLNKGGDILKKSQKIENRTLQRELDKIQSHWDRLKKVTLERHTKLQTCTEQCKKYYRAQNAFLPWLRQAEDTLEVLKPASFKRKDIEKQLRDLSSLRNDALKKSGEFENNNTLGEAFLSTCNIDKDVVNYELGAMKSRWDKINNDLVQRTQSLEDTARHLINVNENLRDLEHGLQRCEDKLASHDSLGGAAKDPKLLDRIKHLREETIALKRPLASVRQQAKDLEYKANEQGLNSTHVQDEVDGIADRIEDLQAKIDDRCNELQSAATAVAEFTDIYRNLSQELFCLEKELDGMKAPGRDIKTVREQIEKTITIQNKINRLSDDIGKLVTSGENLVDSGFAVDAVVTRDQIESLRRQLGKLDERIHSYEIELSAALKRLQQFCEIHANVMDDINIMYELMSKFKPIGSEVDSIRKQQDDFRALKVNKIEPMSQIVDDCNNLGQILIQSAARDINTSNIEKDLDKMNEKWIVLKERLNERDRKLDVGLLQSGKFQEALDGLQKWLVETEEMVANQKPPSSDYKVVKAQLQEQKFFERMLIDRQHSMSFIFNMGDEVLASANSIDRKNIDKQLKNLIGRFDNLKEEATARMRALQKAMDVAKDFQDKMTPLVIWLEKTEKVIREMQMVPTDEEKIQKRIIEHNVLHKDVLSKKIGFTELTDTASILMALVGEEEATSLADKLQNAADRYATLVEISEALGTLLQRSKQGLRHLVLTYQELQVWMEEMENKLIRHRVLAVQMERLLQQMEDLADLSEELFSRQNELDSTTESGIELIKHISSDEALQLKEKLDSLQRRYNELTTRSSNVLKRAQETLPLVQQFYDNHKHLIDWMYGAEAILQSAEPREEEIIRLEMEISEYRPIVDKINGVGPQLCQISPGEGAASIEALVTRGNRRFDTITQQIQRKAERIQLSKQRSLEVICDIDDLLDWFREVDSQLRDAERPNSEPEIIRVQLKEHRAFNDDILSQKGRVRDVICTAKKVMRENIQHEDTAMIREKMDDLREVTDIVSKLSADRLGALEQALPLAEHLRDSHEGLITWLDEAEQQVIMLPMPALRLEMIALQQDKNELLLLSINEHKPLVDKLNKTGEALILLCNEEEAAKVQDILDADNARYLALRSELRIRQQTLEQALQESSQFSDKLEGMLRALNSAAEQARAAEPASAHPVRLRDQMEENTALAEDLVQRSEAFAAVQKAASEVINKALDHSDPAIKDIRFKLEKLNQLWTDVKSSTNNRGRTLNHTLIVAEKFWSDLENVMVSLSELQDVLAAQAPPAAQPTAIEQQQVALQEIRQEIDQRKPDVEQARQSGQELMGLCGESDKPEVRKHIEDLDQAWDNITALYACREENLIHAMEKAMEFHGTLGDLRSFLQEAEEKFKQLGLLGIDIDEIKKQIKELTNFKSEVDPHMVQVEALNRQAAELTQRTSSEQAQAIKEPLGFVNRRWDALLRGVIERQRLLENALLRLGQFQHALDELLIWIEKTNCTLKGLRIVPGDPQSIEVELAKLKVLINDIQAHQTSMDTLNDAGRHIIEDGKGTAEACAATEKLETLNRCWQDLLQKVSNRQRELEDALIEAQAFTAEIQDLFTWLDDIDSAIGASKPVGGLPETASEQLERFMSLYNELEKNRPKVELVLHQGKEYIKRGPDIIGNGYNPNLRMLQQRWHNVTARAGDKKIKLEIALKEATEFHDALQNFVDWLTNAEKILTNLKSVSRVMENILPQIEDHKSFQKDVGVHRETMLNLDKKGTHLKYFSQKQDVILIKNLLISVQHRWERVVSRSAERTRALDHGYKEAREFHDAWLILINWLDESEKILDKVTADGFGGSDSDKIKLRLQKHQEIQKDLSIKQGNYDMTMKIGKTLKDKAPKSDELALRELLNKLKDKWATVCTKCVDHQRKLEEALLFSGQFKDAVQALVAWLQKSEKQLSNTGPLYGDLDTVSTLLEQHKSFKNDLESRAMQMDSVTKTGRDLEFKASLDDATTFKNQLTELHSLWNTVTELSNHKSALLSEALKDAEQLHKAVHILLEWISEAEMKLRFAGQLPEDEQESRNQLIDHNKFLRELQSKGIEKDHTLELAGTILSKAHIDAAAVIKHWITIIQTRWEELTTWANQRNQRLQSHMKELQDLDNLLDELLSWLQGLENTSIALESELLPDDRSTLEALITEHREYMENTARRQNEVDQVCKAKQIKLSKDNRKVLKGKMSASVQPIPGRDKTHDLMVPHIGPRFPAKESTQGAEPEFRSPRVKILWDRWRSVWIMAWKRQRRLQDKLNYVEEVDRVANFSWEEWRKRFLKFMNHKKSRLTDLFRKMDKNNDGLIPRDDFIQGILNTKFDTSRLEMGAVADLFDRHGEGLIDWKEFIAALRPDWEERRSYNDTDKIHDEVKRLVMLCTCRQKFRVFQVGEGKYRFGDSQKLRLVRILRSTVMVRVGGGWVALDEFLVKNDPCRAKGRTNIELREQFILADGVSQSMTAFRSKPSPVSTLQRNPISLAGPITKVRERSSRSIPMGQIRNSRTSLNTSTSDNLSDNENALRTPARKTSTSFRTTFTPGGSRPSSRSASRPSSRPPSRQGSKSSSRYGSTQSLDSVDDPNMSSRIPRRTGACGTVFISSRDNSVSSKKLGVPTNNGSYSHPCTTTSSTSPSIGAASRTRGQSSSAGIPLQQVSKLIENQSGLPENSMTNFVQRKGKQPTPIEQRAPFRL